MAGWHYTDDDAQRSAVDAAEIDRLIAAGTIRADTFVWRAGLPEWERAGAHFEFADASPPPLSHTAPATRTDIGPDGLYVGAPSREIFEAAKVCLTKYATFSGRASRSEFWFVFPVLSLITMFGMLLPFSAVSWRRLHDIDRTGWWLGGGLLASVLAYGAVLGIIVAQAVAGTLGQEPSPVLLGIVMVLTFAAFPYSITIFIFYVTKGTLGPNRFG